MGTNSESLLPYYTAQSSSGLGMFNTAMGKLQRQLYKGEYDIFKYAPIFESDFIQITKRGEVIDVHNRVRMVTVGIACTSPILPLPDVMLLARPATGCEDLAGRGQATKGRNRKGAKTLELTRLLPLKFVRISVHDRDKQQLRLKFATGRSCYLQLCPPLEAREDLFAYWEKLVYLLRPPVDSHSSTYATPAEDTICMPVFEEDRISLPAADFQAKGDRDQVSIRSLRATVDVSAASSAAYAGGEGIQQDSHKAATAPNTPTPKVKEAATVALAGGAATGGVAGALGMVASKSASSGEVTTAMAGGAVSGARGSQSQLAIAGAAKMSPKTMQVALAGAASKSSEYLSSASASLSPEGSMNVAVARVEPSSEAAGEMASDSATGALFSTLQGESHREGQAGRQRARKGRRERKERKEKERAVHRSSRRHRAGEGRHKTEGDKAARKSSSHRAARDDKKEKGRRSPGGSKHSSSHKGVSYVPISKESRTPHKPGRSLSSTTTGTPNKRPWRISAFLRNFRASLTTKGVSSLRSRDVDIVAQTVEKTDVDTIIETAESGQGLEMVGSVTSVVMETVSIEAH